MVWKQMGPLFKKISASSLSPQSLLNQTWIWCAFIISDRPLFEIDSWSTEASVVPFPHLSLRCCVPQCCCTPQSCTAGLAWSCLSCCGSRRCHHPPYALCQHISALSRVCSAGSACTPLPSCPVCCCLSLWAAQCCSELCPHHQLYQLSWSAAPSVILVLGPSRGEPTNLADYFLLLNNCPLSKILWLSNHFHWGAKQLLIQGASSGKVSSIKQRST